MHLKVENNNTKICPQNFLHIIGKAILKIDMGHNMLYFPAMNLTHIIMNKIKTKTWIMKKIITTEINNVLLLSKKRIK